MLTPPSYITSLPAVRVIMMDRCVCHGLCGFKIVVIHAESSNQFALCTFLSSCRQRGILHVRDGVSEPRP